MNLFRFCYLYVNQTPTEVNLGKKRESRHPLSLCQPRLQCLRRNSHEPEGEREREKGDDLGFSDCGVAMLPTCAEEISSHAEEPT